MIVPLFALANAGIHLTGKLMSDAVTSPITLGILIGYVVGKPIGVFSGSWLALAPALHGPRAPISGPVLVAGRRVRGDRLHCLAADLEPRVHRRAAR